MDVFSFEAHANDNIVAEIFAARYSGILDATLTLHDERGNLISFADDQPDSLDPRLEVTIPTNGLFFLSVFDAHDRGSALHCYRLSVKKTN